MIEHEGIIDRIEGETAHVKIQSESACASCHAKGACSAADQEDKYLDVPLRGNEFKPGEVVQVQISRYMGFRAVALGYVYPFLLLMAVLISFTAAGTGELQAGAYALLSIIPYYLVLYLLRKRIGSAFTFSMKKSYSL
jgi:sigma-E factor negative regulatory protein RseC